MKALIIFTAFDIVVVPRPVRAATCFLLNVPFRNKDANNTFNTTPQSTDTQKSFFRKSSILMLSSSISIDFPSGNIILALYVSLSVSSSSIVLLILNHSSAVYTIYMVIIALLDLLLAFLTRNKKKEDEEEEREYDTAIA